MNVAPRTALLAIFILAALPLIMTLTSDRATGVGDGAPPAVDVYIEITDAGFLPASSVFMAGANVHWTNNATATQSVTSDEGLFDSGPLAPGDGFTINIAIPGHHSYHSTDSPAFMGVLKVLLVGLDGPPDAPANDHVPDMPFPPAEDADYSVHPGLAVAASRTKIQVGFNDAATVAQANSALANSGVGLIGGIPEFKTVLGEVDDSADFSIIDAAIESLRSEPAVKFAARDMASEPMVIPRHPEEPDWGIDPNLWEPTHVAADPAIPGGGANYNLEFPRFPQAWNLLEAIAKKNSSIATGIMEVQTYQQHEDLPASVLSVEDLCSFPAINFWCTDRDLDSAHTPGPMDYDHGNHVAGIIGAAYDNPTASDDRRSIGVSGTNPLSAMHGMTVDGLITTSAWDALLDRKMSDLPDLRVVNYSTGFADDRVAWWTAHDEANCGPVANDDGLPGSSEWCSWNNDDAWQAEIESTGMLYREIAERAASLDVTIVQAAGNESNDYCPDYVDANGSRHMDEPELDLLRGMGTAACPSSAHAITFDARVFAPFGMASAIWESTLAKPILVEAQDGSRRRIDFSNLGEVSAPGGSVLSTVLGNQYGTMSGTSMAAPHVTGLIGYLLEYDPSLTAKQVRALVLDRAHVDADIPTTGAGRIDAFASSMALPGAGRDLVDVNDNTIDGNRRVILDSGGGQAGLDTMTGKHTDPDGKVDMRDFRRFRDAWLQTCLDADSEIACLLPNEISLNGPPDILKKDLNFDDCVFDPGPCPAHENWFPRFDFNGDGLMSDTRLAPLALLPDGSPGSPGQATPVTDLDVLLRFWDDAASGSEGWTRADVPDLMDSADIEVHAQAFWDLGATAIDIDAMNTTTNDHRPLRTLAKPSNPLAPDYLVMTLPRGTWNLVARASVNGRQVASSPVPLTPLPAGGDVRVDLTPSDLQLLLSKTSIAADGVSTATAKIRLLDDGAAAPGKSVTLAAFPNGTGHLTIDAPTGVTDANGEFTTMIRAGTQVNDYTLIATADLGGGATLEARRTLSTRPRISIHYLWRQENLGWTEGGSTKWPAPLNAGQPDCTVAGVVDHCLTDWSVSLDQPAPAIERSGVIRGFGNEFRLDETVNDPVMWSTSSWTDAAPDLSNPVASGKQATWSVANDQLTRYTNHALPSTVRATDTAVGIELRGMSALADLEYAYTGGAVLNPGTTARYELGDIIDTLVLGPVRGDASSIQYAGDASAPIFFTRNADGTFEPYAFCGDVDKTFPLPRGYYVSVPSTWGVADTNARDPQYDAGDLPMPEGSQHLHVRYSFVAVASYGDTPPALTLPDCSVNNPPIAGFTYSPSTVLEGRVVQFQDASTDAEHNIASRAWDFGDGETGSGATPWHLYKESGSYTVTLTVTDMSGASDSSSQTISVANLAPEVEVDDASAQAGTPMTINYRSADAGYTDRQSLQFDLVWTYPGIAPMHFTQAANGGQSLSVTLTNPGTYSLTMTVTDPDGGSSSDTATLTVTESPPPPPPPETPGATCDPGVALDEEETAFLSLVNAYRALNGVGPVVASPTLTRAAERHAHDMAVNGFLGHIGTDGSDAFERAQDALYPGNAVGENVANGYDTGVDVLFGWRSSQTGHNENMLDPNWKAVGIAREASSLWSWATSYGNVSDCPEPEFVTSNPALASGADLLGLSALAPGEAERATVTIQQSLTGVAAEVTTSDAPGVADAVLPPPFYDKYGPVPAFVIARANPDAGETVTFRNRSRDSQGNPIAATIDPGTGAPQSVAAAGTMTFAYGTSGVFDATASATDGQSRTAIASRGVNVGTAPSTSTPMPTHTATNTPTITLTPTATSTPGAAVGACFGPQQDLSNGAPFADPSSLPSMAVDGERVYAAWDRSDGVWFRASSDGGATFGAAVRLATRRNPNVPMRPSVAASGATVLVAWMDYDVGAVPYVGQGGELRARVSQDFGATFGAAALLAELDAREPMAAISGGTLYVTNGPERYLLYSVNGGATWTAVWDALVPFEEPEISSPTVERWDKSLISSGGALHVSWRAFNADGLTDTGDSAVWYRKITGTTMDPLIQLAASGAFDSRMAVDGANVYVAWRDATGGILMRRSTDGGGTFLPAVQVTGEAATEIDLSAAGADVFVAWRATGATGPVHLALSHDGGATFGAAESVAGPGAMMPKLALMGGKLFVSWLLPTASSGGSDLKVAVSGDGGASFGGVQSLATGVRSFAPVVGKNGTRAMFAWNALVGSVDADSFFARTVDCADPQASAPVAPFALDRYSAPINVSDGPPYTQFGSLGAPMAASGDHVYVAMETGKFIIQGIPENASSDLVVRVSHDRGTTFGAPVPLAHRTLDALSDFGPHVAASGQQVVVVWRELRSSNGYNVGDLWSAASHDFGATWDPPVRIHQSPVETPRLVHLLTSGDTFYAVWHSAGQCCGFYRYMMSATTDNGATWSAPVYIVEFPGTSTALAAAASGPTLHLVWALTQDGGFTYRQAYRRITNNGATLGGVQLLDWPSGGALWLPNIAASGGRVYVTGGNQQAKYVRRSDDDGVTFGAAVLLPGGIGSTMYPHEFIASGADVYMTRWLSAAPVGRLEVLSSHDYGATWNPPAPLSTSTAYYMRGHVGLTCDGVRALWLFQSNSVVQVYAAASHDGGATFGPAYWLGGNLEEAGAAAPFVTSGETSYAAWKGMIRDNRYGGRADTYFVRTSPNDCAPEPTPTATATATPTWAATFTPTATGAATSTATATAVPTSTWTATSTATHTPVPTSTPTWTGTSTATHTPVLTSTATHTSTPAPTNTPTPTWTPGAGATCTFFDGFLPPVNNPEELNVGKAGKTYPIKWRCADAAGLPVSSLDVVASLGSQQVACTRIEWGGTDALEETTSGFSTLRYDAGSGQYVFDWQTPKSNGTKCYVFVLRLNDGSVHVANFMLKP